MIKRNENLVKIAAGYLFPEINKRKTSYASAHPDAKIISLGIGNTTEPVTPHIAKAMSDYALSLGTLDGYSGYGEDAGMTKLREKIATTFYSGIIDTNEVFISDGAKCDIGRIQLMFGSKVKVAVQDPAYPVYVDGSVMIGAAGKNTSKGYKGMTYMPCLPENNFFPDLSCIKKNSLIYFCSPNNPTGVASTKEELTKLVNFALKNECIIIFDAAYSFFIRDSKLPRTIYEIEGAKKCAIEINSFSKPAGFTGVRLGWSVVPNDLVFADGYKVNKDWMRVITTVFNGASNIAQHGALAALDTEGLAEMKALIDYYLENSRIIRKALESDNFKKMGIEIFGQGNAPYLWVKFPGKKSWEVFDKILDQCHVVTTPGSGFGPSGESFIRFSSFGHRADVEEAAKRLTKLVL